MKTTLRYLIKGALALFMVMAVGCEADNSTFEQPDNVINPDNDDVSSDSSSSDGYFSINNVAVTVNTENEVISRSSSSSYDEAGDDYLILIYNDDKSEEHYRGFYSTVKSLTAPLTLPVGNYLIYATSLEKVPSTEWDAPEYASSYRDFSIGADKTTSYDEDVVCTMSNIKTSVSVSADLKALFKADKDIKEGETPLQILLEMGEANITYSSSETRSGYFAVQDGISTIDVTLSGMYNTAADGEEASYAYIEWKQSVSDVAAGQARNISVEIAHYNDGVLEIKFVITSWVYDDVIGVLTSSKFGAATEGSIYDPDDDASDPYSPEVTLDGEYELNYYVYPDIFDNDFLTYSPSYTATITLLLGSTVSSVMVIPSSTNTDFTDAITGAGFGSSIPLWSDNELSSSVSSWIDITESGDGSGDLVATITYEGMKAFESYLGTHTLKTIVTDSESRRSVTPLMVYSVVSGVLDIVWQGDYSFDNTYEIGATDDKNSEYVALPVIFDITSKTGLTGLSIDINSDVLTADELASLNLATSMDLINPATEAMESRLLDLGFPVGDGIEGQSYLSFDISSFMPLLAALSDEGSGDATSFVITAEDASGECIKTLSVVRK